MVQGLGDTFRGEMWKTMGEMGRTGHLDDQRLAPPPRVPPPRNKGRQIMDQVPKLRGHSSLIFSTLPVRYKGGKFKEKTQFRGGGVQVRNNLPLPRRPRRPGAGERGVKKKKRREHWGAGYIVECNSHDHPLESTSAPRFIRETGETSAKYR